MDRAVCEDEQEGFIQLVLVKDRLVGATVVAPCAGEMASELGLAIHRRLPVRALASCVHAYPSYCFALQQMAAEATYEQLRQSRRRPQRHVHSMVLGANRGGTKVFAGLTVLNMARFQLISINCLLTKGWVEI